jgi:DNA-binding LacI/PurR family transcriptional regulator
VAVIARQVRDSSVHVVRTADEEGARQAVEHLVSLGHQDIVHLDGGRAPGAAERRRGYRAAMRRHGLAGQARIMAGGLTEESGYAAAQVLRESPGSLPTAIVAFNDRCAVGMLDTFIRAGIAVPADVSIVGYDDDRLSRLPHISLTTVRQDASRMARLAVDSLIARLEGNEAGGREVVIPPQLVIRGTTGPPRNGVGG